MKSKIFTAVLLCALLLSCNKKTETETTVVETETVDPSVDLAVKECYQMANANDTVMLAMATNANNVNGELTYNLKEKDANKGTISGIFIGDTLFADYTFQSEGMTSVREAVFVKKGNTLVQGTGAMEEKDNKLCFKNPRALTFDSAMVLQKMDCK